MSIPGGRELPVHYLSKLQIHLFPRHLLLFWRREINQLDVLLSIESITFFCLCISVEGTCEGKLSAFLLSMTQGWDLGATHYSRQSISNPAPYAADITTPRVCTLTTLPLY
jgi:hypothetical protein